MSLKYISEVKTYAQKNAYHWKVVCGVIFRGKLVAYYYNSATVHAEENCLRHLLRLSRRYKGQFDLIVIRVHHDGTFANSKPCSYCSGKIRNHPRIRNVFWCTNEILPQVHGCFSRDLENKHRSVGIAERKRCKYII